MNDEEADRYAKMIHTRIKGWKKKRGFDPSCESAATYIRRFCPEAFQSGLSEHELDHKAICLNRSEIKKLILQGAQDKLIRDEEEKREKRRNVVILVTVVAVVAAGIWGISMIPEKPLTTEQIESRLYDQLSSARKTRDYSMRKAHEYMDKNNPGMAWEWNQDAIKYNEQVEYFRRQINALEARKNDTEN